jgi:hypothetical protein
MSVEKNLTERQGKSDLQLGLDSLEELRHLRAQYRARLDEAYGAEFKKVLQDLLTISDGALRTLQNHLEAFHPDAPENESSPEGLLLRPEVPEWRPGPHTTSSND